MALDAKDRDLLRLLGLVLMVILMAVATCHLMGCSAVRDWAKEEATEILKEKAREIGDQAAKQAGEKAAEALNERLGPGSEREREMWGTLRDLSLRKAEEAESPITQELLKWLAAVIASLMGVRLWRGKSEAARQAEKAGMKETLRSEIMTSLRGPQPPG